MELRKVFQNIDFSKFKLKIKYDRKSEGRPAWIWIDGLPENVSYISVHLGKKGKKGYRIQAYKKYLSPETNLFLPIDFTHEEMRRYYDEFSKTYDQSIRRTEYNTRAARFLVSKLKKYKKNGEVLDLGCGTGLVSEILTDFGYGPITLVDYSKGMLEKAKKRKKLSKCRFILSDVKKLKLNKKYEIISSFFSLGNSSYYTEEEFTYVLKKIKKNMKSNGMIMILGHMNNDILKEEFKVLSEGIFILDKKKKFYADYFIGKK